ncbi:unnamed protein product [Soboliphyme baturini]|uniref:NADH dehydrogenase [ubiquinone] 1 alpha subcomplex subunit 7 n=1 Tax=Soboliphyme baturini TaxID=241478 RepID=A0A183IZ99_9BILA|nr:unnamed protein product [Soboliphyme baturini]
MATRRKMAQNVERVVQSPLLQFLLRKCIRFTRYDYKGNLIRTEDCNPRRYQDELSARDQPDVPNIPGGIHHRLSANYYYERDARRNVGPPKVIVEAEAPLFLTRTSCIYSESQAYLSLCFKLTSLSAEFMMDVRILSQIISLPSELREPSTRSGMREDNQKAIVAMITHACSSRSEIGRELTKDRDEKSTKAEMLPVKVARKLHVPSPTPGLGASWVRNKSAELPWTIRDPALEALNKYGQCGGL